MPKQVINYSNTIIYKLIHNADTENRNIYVGHTTDLTRRKQYHKRSCNNPTYEAYNTKKYVEIRANGGWGEWEMRPIELYPCANESEALIREEYWRSHLNAQLNMIKSHQTEEKRQEALKAFAKVYNPVYYQKHKDDEHFKEVRRKYREENKEYLNKKINENYYNNKEVILAHQKEYYHANKEEILERNKEKLTCECGRIVARGNMSEHHQSKIHIDCMNGVEIKEQQEKGLCECGCEIRKKGLVRHRKTKKHIDLMEQK
jgi:hypothetical protein